MHILNQVQVNLI